MTVVQDEQAKKPVMYYGRRNKSAETHRKDTIFCFGDDMVILRNEWQANYDEIPLFGDGTYAEFSFDNENRITRVAFRYITDSRLGFWSEEQVCELDKKTKQSRPLPTQILEKADKASKQNNKTDDGFSK